MTDLRAFTRRTTSKNFFNAMATLLMLQLYLIFPIGKLTRLGDNILSL